MSPEQEKILKEKIITYMCGISKKSILETYEDIADMYDNGDIKSEDFYKIMDELATKMRS